MLSVCVLVTAYQCVGSLSRLDTVLVFPKYSSRFLLLNPARSSRRERDFHFSLLTFPVYSICHKLGFGGFGGQLVTD